MMAHNSCLHPSTIGDSSSFQGFNMNQSTSGMEFPHIPDIVTWNIPQYQFNGFHVPPQFQDFCNASPSGYSECDHTDKCSDSVPQLNGNSAEIKSMSPQYYYYGLNRYRENYYGLDNPGSFQENRYPNCRIQENQDTFNQSQNHYYHINQNLYSFNPTSHYTVNPSTTPSPDFSKQFVGVPASSFLGRHPVVLYQIPSTDLCYVYSHFHYVDNSKALYVCKGCFLKDKHVPAEVIDHRWFTKDPICSGHICRPRRFKRELTMRQVISMPYKRDNCILNSQVNSDRRQINGIEMQNPEYSSQAEQTTSTGVVFFNQ